VAELSEDKKEPNYWKAGVFDTVSLLLATVAGIWEGDLVISNPFLLYSIEAVLTIIVFLALYIQSKFNEDRARTFARIVLKGITWVTALLAGNIFAYGYALALAFPKIGIVGPAWLVLYFVFVAWVIRLTKVREYALEKKIHLAKQGKKTQNP